LRAAVELQRRLRTATDEEPAFPIGVGMGLDAGEAVPTQGGYRGASLNLAARLCALAKPGQILASETVIGLASRVEGMRYLEGHSAALKGISRPVRFVVVAREEPLPPPPPAPRAPGRPGSIRVRRTLVVGGVALLAAIAIAVVIVSTSGGPTGGRLAADSLAQINPVSGRILSDVAVGTTPDAVAASKGEAWVADLGAQTVADVSQGGGPAQFQSAGGAPTGICLGGGFVWIALAFQDQVARISIATKEPSSPISVGAGPDAILYADGAAWVALRNDNAVQRISPSGRVGPEIPVGEAPTATRRDTTLSTGFTGKPSEFRH
jgi:hypothetical protein